MHSIFVKIATRNITKKKYKLKQDQERSASCHEWERLRGLGEGEKKMELKKKEWERLRGLILILDPDP